MLFQRSTSSLILCILIAVALPVAQGQVNVTVDPCPDATWKDAVFLKDPKDPVYFKDVAHWKGEQIRSYVQDDVLVEISPSLAFLIMALISLLIFVLWRTIHACCLCCCCAASCAARRDAADIRTILKGWGMWVIKGSMLVLSIVAICLAIYGMSKTKREIIQEGWDAIDFAANYTRRVADRADDLLNNASAVLPVLTDFRTAVETDVNPAAFRPALRGVQTFLDAPPTQPVALKAALAAANADLAALRSQAADWRTYITTLQTKVPLLDSAVASIAASAALFTTISTATDALQTACNGLPVADPGTSAATVVALGNALTQTAAISTWITSLNTLSSSLDEFDSQRGIATTTYGAAAASLSSLRSTVASAGGASGTLAAASAKLSGYSAARSASAANTTWVLNQLVVINTTFIRLDNATNAAYKNMVAADAAISDLMASNPTPSSMATKLTSVQTATTLPADSATLNTELTTISNQLGAAPAVASFKAYVLSLRSALVTLQPLRATTNTNYNNYKAAPGLVTYGTMRTQAPNTEIAAANAKAATVQGAAASDISAIQSAGSTIDALAPAGRLAAQATAADGITNAINTNMPSSNLNGYVAAADALVTKYAGFPPKASDLLAPADQALTTIEGAYEGAGNAQADANQTIADVGSVGKDLRKDVVGRIDDIRGDFFDTSSNIGEIRYKVQLALYGVSIAIVLLIILVSVINCPCGIAFMLLVLYVWIVLYFLLSVVAAVVLTGANDACPAVETVVIENVDAKVQPVAQYVFFNAGGDVRTVLNTTGIVDVAVVDSQIQLAQTQVTQALISAYTPIGDLSALLTRINNTANATQAALDGLINMLAYAELHPVYVRAKGFVCCTAADEFGVMWNVLTFCGWLLMVLGWFGNALLGRLDKLPMSGCCCACACISAADADRVKPSTEEGGEGPMKGMKPAEHFPADAPHPSPQDHPPSQVVPQPPAQQRMGGYNDGHGGAAVVPAGMYYPADPYNGGSTGVPPVAADPYGNPVPQQVVVAVQPGGAPPAQYYPAVPAAGYGPQQV